MINYEEHYLPLCVKHNIKPMPKDVNWGDHWEAIQLAVSMGEEE